MSTALVFWPSLATFIAPLFCLSELTSSFFELVPSFSPPREGLFPRTLLSLCVLMTAQLYSTPNRSHIG